MDVFRFMSNAKYGVVRGWKTKVGRKQLVFILLDSPTTLSRDVNVYDIMLNLSIPLLPMPQVREDQRF